jgi:hypothetical protein
MDSSWGLAIHIKSLLLWSTALFLRLRAARRDLLRPKQRRQISGEILLAPARAGLIITSLIFACLRLAGKPPRRASA